MHLYRQSVILFGMVLPLIATAMAVGTCLAVKSKIDASFATKQADFKAATMARMAAGAVEDQVTRQRPDLERWTTQLTQETVSATTTNLQTIAKHLPGKEFQQTAFPTRGASSGLGTISTQKSSEIRIAFRGTFRTMQQAFLELETQMPQLQLQELKIDPVTTQPSHLNLQVTYTAWEK